jgi:hypothetical protein
LLARIAAVVIGPRASRSLAAGLLLLQALQAANVR